MESRQYSEPESILEDSLKDDPIANYSQDSVYSLVLTNVRVLNELINYQDRRSTDQAEVIKLQSQTIYELQKQISEQSNHIKKIKNNYDCILRKLGSAIDLKDSSTTNQINNYLSQLEEKLTGFDDRLKELEKQKPLNDSDSIQSKINQPIENEKNIEADKDTNKDNNNDKNKKRNHSEIYSSNNSPGIFPPHKNTKEKVTKIKPNQVSSSYHLRRKQKS